MEMLKIMHMIVQEELQHILKMVHYLKHILMIMMETLKALIFIYSHKMIVL